MPTPQNTVHVRENNTSLIRSMMRSMESATKAQLASLTGLSVATCGKILGEMVESGEVRELELGMPEGGRPPRFFTYNPLYSLTVCLFPKALDGKNTLVYQIRDAKNCIIENDARPVANADLAAIEALLDAITARYNTIKTIALSIPGIVWNGRIGICDIHGLTGLDAVSILAERYGVPVYADNDTNLAAFGYYHGLCCEGSLAYMVLPQKTCTGAGIVINGEIVRGNTAFAGELSFIPFGISRARQFEGMMKDDIIEYTALLASAVIPVVNPATFVVASEIMTEDTLAKIRDTCLRHIPEEHLPKFIMRTSLDEDCFCGLALVAEEPASRILVRNAVMANLA